MNHEITKIKLESIVLTRLEGGKFDCDQPIVVKSWAAADRQLRVWSSTAPRQGYDKCSFQILFNDASGEYTGRYDLKHSTCRQEDGQGIDLARRVRSHLEACIFHGSVEAQAFLNTYQI